MCVYSWSSGITAVFRAIGGRTVHEWLRSLTRFIILDDASAGAIGSFKSGGLWIVGSWRQGGQGQGQGQGGGRARSLGDQPSEQKQPSNPRTFSRQRCFSVLFSSFKLVLCGCGYSVIHSLLLVSFCVFFFCYIQPCAVVVSLGAPPGNTAGCGASFPLECGIGSIVSSVWCTVLCVDVCLVCRF